MNSVHLEGIGPVRLEYATLVEPQPIRLGGKPWGAPRYGVRCHLIEPLPALCEAVDAVVLRQWPEGPPQQLRHPIQPGGWFHAGTDAEHPPELFHLDADAIVPGLGPVRALEGATALVNVTVQAYQTTPWAGGCDVLLRAVCIVEAGQHTGAAAGFARVLSTAA
jgi:hypothetical protein